MAEPSQTAAPVVPEKRYRNLAQRVVEAITNNIQAGLLKPGEKLPTESAIMAMHGVSRTVVREAISHLQAAGVVKTRHGIGTFVLEPPPANLGLSADSIITVRDVLAMLELRISVEMEAAGLAAVRRTEAQVMEMQQVLETMHTHVAKGEASVEADVQFHLLIAQATGNRYFVEILNHLGTTIIPRARVNLAQIGHDAPAAYLQRVHGEHEAILDAIVHKDPEAARAAMRTHLDNSRERLRRAQEEIGRA